MSETDLRRLIPAVGPLLDRDDLAELCDRHGRGRVKEALSEVLEELRERMAEEGASVLDETEKLCPAVEARLGEAGPSMRRVINATGVVLHTNLGRAPLSALALQTLAGRVDGYLNVEMDLETGARGKRASGLAERLGRLTGCEAAMVVNNNAAAVMLTLDTLARDRDVIVSRGELVEIGGAFRVPDVMAQSGARLVEVGTTNRTRIRDYAEAISEQTGALLKVHPSNFRIVGFTEEASLREITLLASERDVVSIYDLGSGALSIPRADGAPVVRGEETVREALAAGFDVVTFSGDKLLGGPQSGLILGKRELLARIRRNPLYRALRVDKVTLLLLEATLISYERGAETREVPAQRMLAVSVDDLKDRALAIAEEVADLNGLQCRPSETRAAAGGGSAPLDRIASFGLRVEVAGLGADATLARLRRAPVPIVGRIEDDAVWLDLRTVDPADDGSVVDAIRALPSSEG